MAVLSTAQRAILQSLINYLQGNHDLPIPSEVVERLDTVFGGTSGFVCACGIRGTSLRDALRDVPIQTLLRLIVAVSDAAPVGPLTPTTSGPKPPL